MSVTKEFILAGRAVFTIETALGHHCTFKVIHKAATMDWDEAYFVSMLTGSDNENDFTYFGMLDKDGTVRLTKRSKATTETFAFKLLNRILFRIWRNEHNEYEKAGFKTHHEGRCGRCGRTLTVPPSIESGIGPECAEKMGIERAAREKSYEDPTESWSEKETSLF